MEVTRPPTLYLICGKIGAGKSTLATKNGRKSGRFPWP